jgi:hypothetical protein
MKQRILAMMTGFEQYKKTRRAIFLEEMEQVVPWRELCGLLEPHYPRLETGGHWWELNACCGFTFCSSGSTCRTQRWRRRCTTRRRCGSSWADRQNCVGGRLAEPLEG